MLVLMAGAIAAAELDKKAFADCISASGAKYYAAHWCPYCKKQNQMFGRDWVFLPYIECSAKTGRTQLARCSHISGYPTWIFPEVGERSGVQSFGELERYTGCRLAEKDYFVD
jgi:hypothetical protein